MNEVSADGHSARVTFGVHRLTRPKGVAPGESFRVRLSLKGVAYRFSAGCRLRLALSTAIGQWFGPSRVKGRCSCGRTARYYNGTLARAYIG